MLISTKCDVVKAEMSCKSAAAGAESKKHGVA